MSFRNFFLLLLIGGCALLLMAADNGPSAHEEARAVAADKAQAVRDARATARRERAERAIETELAQRGCK